MSISSYTVKHQYTGAGNLADYTFNFKIGSLSQLLIVSLDATGAEVKRVRGTDTVFLSSVDFDPVLGGGTVHLAANLATGHKLFIFLANDAPIQASEFKNKFDFTLKRIEDALDYLAGAVQRISYIGSIGLKFHDTTDMTAFNPMLPPLPVTQSAILALNDDNTGLEWGPSVDQITSYVAAAQAAQAAAEAAQAAAEVAQAAAEAAAATGGVPVGGATGAVLAKASATDGDAIWNQYAFSGFSSRFSALFNSTDLQDTLAKIIAITYTPPTISLAASGSGTIREKGASVASTTLTATVTKRSDPIAEVRFYRNPSTLLDTKTGTIPTGGSENTTYSTAFSDNVTFRAEVDDNGATGGPTTVSATASFTFVYPYYVGAGAVGLSAAAVSALTKRIINSTATQNETIVAANGNVLYFAYPASYGALTSILDVNNFETIGDWTLRTENITGLDATAVSYRIYEFNNPVVAGSYYYSFRR